jgi:hypothetical protein
MGYLLGPICIPSLHSGATLMCCANLCLRLTHVSSLHTLSCVNFFLSQSQNPSCRVTAATQNPSLRLISCSQSYHSHSRCSVPTHSCDTEVDWIMPPKDVHILLLWICYCTQWEVLCRFESGVCDGEIMLDYLESIRAGIRETQSRAETVMMEVRGWVIQGRGHEPRNEGSL